MSTARTYRNGSGWAGAPHCEALNIALTFSLLIRAGLKVNSDVSGGGKDAALGARENALRSEL